jgi:hypothetical protein
LPIRALLNGKDIYSYEYDSVSWKQLKGKSLITPCCGTRAIRKTSQLGTQFFAHYKKGDCASKPETIEHLSLKSLIAQAAIAFEWSVTTEKIGQAPDGEKWIADVYCEKPKGKLVFEVQWSSQTKKEFFRRQQKYQSSGVRALWLFRLKGSGQYSTMQLPYTQDVPVFGMRYLPKTKELFIPQFDQSVPDFINGVLSGGLRWTPSANDKLFAQIIPRYDRCWKCKKYTGIVAGVRIVDSHEYAIAFYSFDKNYYQVPEFVTQHANQSGFKKLGVGLIRKRSEHNVDESYIVDEWASARDIDPRFQSHRMYSADQSNFSNSCVHCDALVGYVFDDTYEALENAPYPYGFGTYTDKKLTPIQTVEITNGREFPRIDGNWYFYKQKTKNPF